MLFSIITPCYNSSKTLRRTYESLLKQKEKDFEWILIDDASPDSGETRKLILELAEQAPFVVKYKFLSENQFGSKSAYTAALLASGKFACILDHDDELVSTALADVKKIIYDYDIVNQEKLAGVCGRCLNENGKLIGPKFYEDSFQANEGVIRFRKKITCELFQFTKLEIVKNCFFEIKPGYTNGYCWAKISERFDYIYTNTVFRVYDTYNPESYSNKYKKIVVFPENKRVAVKKTILSYRKYLFFNPGYSIRLCASFIRHCILSNCFFIVKGMPVFFYLSLPISIPLAYLKSKIIYRNM